MVVTLLVCVDDAVVDTLVLAVLERLLVADDDTELVLEEV